MTSSGRWDAQRARKVGRDAPKPDGGRPIVRVQCTRCGLVAKTCTPRKPCIVSWCRGKVVRADEVAA